MHFLCFKSFSSFPFFQNIQSKYQVIKSHTRNSSYCPYHRVPSFLTSCSPVSHASKTSDDWLFPDYIRTTHCSLLRAFIKAASHSHSAHSPHPLHQVSHLTLYIQFKCYLLQVALHDVCFPNQGNLPLLTSSIMSCTLIIAYCNGICLRVIFLCSALKLRG